MPTFTDPLDQPVLLPEPNKAVLQPFHVLLDIAAVWNLVV
jgi:hypothetical protein